MANPKWRPPSQWLTIGPSANPQWWSRDHIYNNNNGQNAEQFEGKNWSGKDYSLIVSESGIISRSKMLP
jgi:hypothetical protein